MSSSGRVDVPWLFVDEFGTKGDGVTDDTTRFTNAVTAAHNIGANLGVKCPLYLTPGKNYLLSQVFPQSYVEIIGYGATVSPAGGSYPSVGPFSNNQGGAVYTPFTQFALRGITFAAGTGLDSSNGVVEVGLSSYMTFEDLNFSNLGGVALSVKDSQNAWVHKNIVNGASQVAGVGNAITFSNSNNGNTSPLQNIWAWENYVNAQTGILFTDTSVPTPNRTDPNVNAHLWANTCIVPVGAHFFVPMGIEKGNAVQTKGYDFVGNTCTQLNSGAFAFQLSSTTTTDPLNISGVNLTANHFYANASNSVACLVGAGSHSAHTGNHCESTDYDFQVNNAAGYSLVGLTIVGNTGKFGIACVQTTRAPDFATFVSEGNTRFGPETVAVPASGTAVAQVGRNRTYYVTAGTGGCTMTLQDGKAIIVPAATLGTVMVPAGQTVTPTYTNAPTWIVEGY